MYQTALKIGYRITLTTRLNYDIASLVQECLRQIVGIYWMIKDRTDNGWWWLEPLLECGRDPLGKVITLNHGKNFRRISWMGFGAKLDYTNIVLNVTLSDIPWKLIF